MSRIAEREDDVSEEAYCCFIDGDDNDCPKAATWRAYWDGPPADSFTDGCEDHIGHLLSPDLQNIHLEFIGDAVPTKALA